MTTISTNYRLFLPFSGHFRVTRNTRQCPVLSGRFRPFPPIYSLVRPFPGEKFKKNSNPIYKENKIESRLKAVEDAIKAAERKELDRTDPAKSARAQSTLELIEIKLAKTEKELQEATSKGDAKKVDSLTKTIETQKMLLEATKNTLAEFTR